ncbi:hypothetical protein GH714_043866 [Hevea brasiliensis]|uniref:Uncharacterized protein n=1 Tax=Hevea brasiliensis TaxID=3981 RepID=A0A6A6K0Z8_HEVBR|nr:hypothetical protein GH714_043866 [Hevea brasiliensis]
MKPESLVIAGQPYGGEFVPGLVHTARHTMGAGHARSRYLNRKEGDAEGRASDWSEVVTSTLGWHSLKVKGEVQTRKGLRWIPRHPETRKGVVSDEMLRGVENKRRSGDSRIGQPFKLLLNPWAGKRQPGELKHLSNQRKRKQKRFP